MQKKGQITFFIILGLAIIFSLMFYFAIYQTSLADKPMLPVTDVSGITECSNRMFIDTLNLLSYQGGYLNLPDNSVDTLFGKIPVYLENKILNMPSEEVLKKSLSQQISILAEDCLAKNMKPLGEDIITDIMLNANEASATINYPYVIMQGDKQRVTPLINVKSQARILTFYNVVKQIIDEIKNEPMIVPASFLFDLEEKYNFDIETYWEENLVFYFITEINPESEKLTWMFAVRK